MRYLVLTGIIAIVLSSCSKQEECRERIDLSAIQENIQFNRLEKELLSIKEPKDVQQFLANHPVVANQYMGYTKKDSAEFAKALFDFYTNPQLKEFSQNGEKINNGFLDLEPNLNQLFKHIKFYFPGYENPQVNTITTGFYNEDIFVGDTIVVISLDYFYGEKSKFRPNEYGYMLSRRKPELVVPSLAWKMGVEKFALKDSKDETLLNDMVSWGKVHYFMEKVMPCVPDTGIIMYSNTELEDVNKHLDIIWGHFLENKLFYETRADIKRRYVEEAPKVAVIGDKCPGRIGRYLGWMIVRAYMEKNPELSLMDLMKETDSQKIFKLSKYKPKVK